MKYKKIHARPTYRIYENARKFIKAIKKDILYAPIFEESNTKYMRVCSGCDTETTRIDKKSYIYMFQLSINKRILLCRTWSDFLSVIHFIKTFSPYRIIIWIANLGYEFSFFQNRFDWSNVFAKEERHPITATIENKIEFRDCLSISGQGGLENLAKNYTQTQKMTGDVDFTIIRNSKTKIKPKEKTYMINDVAILSEWAEYIFKTFSDKGKKIPLTKTGIVRNLVKEAAEPKKQEILKAVSKLFPNNVKEYNFLMRYLFRGGYTHANIIHVGETIENVSGVDFTSSYPAVMLHNTYPVTKFYKTEIETDGQEITDTRFSKQAFYFVCKFNKIKSKTYHSIESSHKIIEHRNAIWDNGRLSKADFITVCITEIDYKIYKMFYEWETIEIMSAHTAQKARLPNYLLSPMMSEYKKKNDLKKEGKDGTPEYANAKANVNSFYGMCVTRLNFSDFLFVSGAWCEVPSGKSYEQQKHFQYLSPFWGIYITAYARLALLENVYEMDMTDNDNVVYCDTDSIYFRDSPKCREIIKKYNEKMYAMNEKYDSCFYDIGAFDYIDNGVHYRFKTLGAKRYIKQFNNKISVTVAGMRKNTLQKSVMIQDETDFPIIEKNEIIGYFRPEDVFEKFENKMYMNIYESEKNTVKYNDEEHTDIIDGEEMTEKSSCCVYPIPFSLRMDEKYLILIKQLQEGRRKPHD